MPQPIDRNAEDHLAAMKALLPRGAVWPRDNDSAISRVCSGIATTATRLRQRAGQLIVDAFPSTTYELLPDWERSLRLPDPCAGPAPSIQQRRAQVVARVTATGGQSAPYFVQVAAALGYAVTVKNYGPARLGHMRLGDRMFDARWAHVWAIRAPTTTITSFRMGMSGLGERFRSWGNEVLECELRARAPAHTILLFQYS
ncbi:YmfQ family protein [Pararoseomonas indoligenes]|uniref:DUF2313 domain-containing protein n=1 Tax=Roseomonas indoligenes TaxID=2820811 RepID=A0A940MRJ1_9PROT|nr:putative phage tail protein [Pararoseomonas indoligenes]MBP0492154.1 DUF2313 domain-containing protein [Pararoseomonas indoligenes]